MYKIWWKFKKRADVFLFFLFLERHNKKKQKQKNIIQKSSQGRQASALAKEPL